MSPPALLFFCDVIWIEDLDELWRFTVNLITIPVPIAAASAPAAHLQMAIQSILPPVFLTRQRLYRFFNALYS